MMLEIENEGLRVFSQAKLDEQYVSVMSAVNWRKYDDGYRQEIKDIVYNAI